MKLDAMVQSLAAMEQVSDKRIVSKHMVLSWDSLGFGSKAPMPWWAVSALRAMTRLQVQHGIPGIRRYACTTSSYRTAG
jgi:hypothetical protein